MRGKPCKWKWILVSWCLMSVMVVSNNLSGFRLDCNQLILFCCLWIFKSFDLSARLMESWLNGTLRIAPWAGVSYVLSILPWDNYLEVCKLNLLAFADDFCFSGDILIWSADSLCSFCFRNLCMKILPCSRNMS